MNKLHILLPALAVLPLMTQLTAQEPMVRPEHKAVITCYNGKIDSRSHCSTTNFQKDGTLFPTGGPMRCGFPGKVSAISWTLIEGEGDGDHYEFVRVFPHGEDDAKMQKKRIRFRGKRMIIFKDDHQVVVIDPAPKSSTAEAEPGEPDQPASAPGAKVEGQTQPQSDSEARPQ